MSIFLYVFQSDDRDICVGIYIYIFYTFYGLLIKNTKLHNHKGIGTITLVNELMIKKPKTILFS